MIEALHQLDRPSACGLAALILIAEREQTSVGYQYKEWNFLDIPRSIIDYIDELEGYQYLGIACELIREVARNYADA